MTNNYFKCTMKKKFVFFDDRSESSIYNAYNMILLLAEECSVCVWNIPDIAGPWQALRGIR